MSGTLRASIDFAERERILRALDEGQATARRGEHGDAEEFVAELLARGDAWRRSRTSD